MTNPSETSETDDHLRALGGYVRARLAERPSEWEAVVAGDRAPDETAALRAAAGDDPEEIERAEALFRPLDAAEQDALVEALLGRRSREVAATADGARVIELADHRPADPAVVPSRAPESTRNAVSGWWGLAAVAAVLVVGWLLWTDRSSSQPPGTDDLVAVAPLPAYRLELAGGLQPLRGAHEPDPPVPVYRGDSTFEWTMRPQVPVEGQVEARVLAQRDGEARTLPTEGGLEIDDGGAVRLAGRISSLGLAPGPWTIVFVVGRHTALAREPALVDDGGEGWVVGRQRILVEP